MITPDVLSQHGITDSEYDRIKGILKREPTFTELGIFSVMWSEHCSYKSSRVHLKRLPTQGAAVLQGPGVTVSFSCEFLDAAHEGELVECDGEISRAGGSLIFLRGMLRSGERSLFSFSGTIKRVKWKPGAGPAT